MPAIQYDRFIHALVYMEVLFSSDVKFILLKTFSIDVENNILDIVL